MLTVRNLRIQAAIVSKSNVVQRFDLRMRRGFSTIGSGMTFSHRLRFNMAAGTTAAVRILGRELWPMKRPWYHPPCGSRGIALTRRLLTLDYIRIKMAPSTTNQQFLMVHRSLAEFFHRGMLAIYQQEYAGMTVSNSARLLGLQIS